MLDNLVVAVARKAEVTEYGLYIQNCFINNKNLPIMSKFVPYSRFLSVGESKLDRRIGDTFYNTEGDIVNVNDDTLPLVEGTVMVGLILKPDDKYGFERFYPITALVSKGDDDAYYIYEFRSKTYNEVYTKIESILDLSINNFAKLRYITSKNFTYWLKKSYSNKEMGLYDISHKNLEKYGVSIEKIQLGRTNWKVNYRL